MVNISRRHLTNIGLTLPLILLSTAAAPQEDGRSPRGRDLPQIKWSEAKPIIKEYVEKLSAASKQSVGVEFTNEQKDQLVSSIMANMQAEHIYTFVDPQGTLPR
jgi:hypothetical protein